jgi:hypothetical protein
MEDMIEGPDAEDTVYRLVGRVFKVAREQLNVIGLEGWIGVTAVNICSEDFAEPGCYLPISTADV